MTPIILQFTWRYAFSYGRRICKSTFNFTIYQKIHVTLPVWNMMRWESSSMTGTMILIVSYTQQETNLLQIRGKCRQLLQFTSHRYIRVAHFISDYVTTKSRQINRRRGTVFIGAARPQGQHRETATRSTGKSTCPAIPLLDAWHRKPRQCMLRNLRNPSVIARGYIC